MCKLKIICHYKQKTLTDYLKLNYRKEKKIGFNIIVHSHDIKCLQECSENNTIYEFSIFYSTNVIKT